MIKTADARVSMISLGCQPLRSRGRKAEDQRLGKASHPWQCSHQGHSIGKVSLLSHHHHHQNQKPYQVCQPSSTTPSPHGVLLGSSYIIHSPAERLSRICLGESNVRNKRNATPAVLETNAIRSQSPISSPGIDTWLTFLVRLYAHIDPRHTHTTAFWCEDLTGIHDR